MEPIVYNLKTQQIRRLHQFASRYYTKLYFALDHQPTNNNSRRQNINIGFMTAFETKTDIVDAPFSHF